MKNQFLEAGKIVNTHGIQGEVKIMPWTDTPDFFCQFKTLYLDDAPVKVLSARVQKSCVLVRLEGVDDINSAMVLKGKVVSVLRSEIRLPEGRHFLADLIGLEVRNADTGEVLGTLTEVLPLPANQVYVVKGTREYLIPAVEEFLIETNVEEGFLRVHLLEGM